MADKELNRLYWDGGLSPLFNGDIFGSCCGTKYMTADKVGQNFKRQSRVIKLAIGVHAEPSDNGKTEVAVVQTQNGPLTVSSRYAI